ncbi:hypothetical protein [Actinomadura fibrosa]|uniref:Uncharacterized protein n=1 Tax=Actinomadura fibrosa TaxID=111802 RepID=A0ABW2XDU3_9ACTN|nr:hypothetical protein [Actinomadura fibrosa]
MTDPLTLSVLGGAVLTQGVTFIYGQASELLKSRRERREPEMARQRASIPLDVSMLEGHPAPLVANLEVLDHVADEVAELRRRLSDYTDEIKPVTPADQDLLLILDALRGLLEAVYGQRFTFRGEDRQPSGPVIAGTINAEEVLGRAVAVRIGRVSGAADITGNAKVERIDKGAEVIGVDVDKLGD